MQAQLVKFKKFALDLFLPQNCLGCGQEGSALCLSCTKRLPRVFPPLCSRCGLTLTSSSCPDCQQQEASFDGLRAPFRFEGLVREAIHQLKYRNLRCLAGTLADELASYARNNLPPVDVVMPVPLHKNRLRERGYNQAGLVAKELGRVLGLVVDCSSLIRILDSRPQVRLEGAASRKQNVRGAFHCPRAVTGSKVLVIDDVATSGSTIDSCAVALKTAGAASVWGLTIARDELKRRHHGTKC